MYENLKKLMIEKYRQENYFARRIGMSTATLQSRLRGLAKWKPDEIELINRILDYDLTKRND